MKSGAQSGKFLLILSKDYLRSEYCMFELLAIWRACKWDAEIFRERVRPWVLDAGVDTLDDRDAVRAYWKSEFDRITQRLIDIQEARGDIPPDYNDRRNLANNLTSTAPTILHHIADCIHIRGMDAIGQLRF